MSLEKMIHYVALTITDLCHKMSTEYKKSTDFYQQIDMVFDRLIETYGLNDDIITYKSDLLDIYENENKYKSAAILKAIKVKHWIIDENGYIKAK